MNAGQFAHHPDAVDAAPIADAVAVGTSAGAPGRFVLSARGNHFVSDSRLADGEAVHAGELLLSALASCALANIEHNAASDGLELDALTARASHVRGTDDPTVYDRTLLELEIHGPGVRDAEELATKFVATCPIYNTIRRGSGVELRLNGRGLAPVASE